MRAVIRGVSFAVLILSVMGQHCQAGPSQAAENCKPLAVQALSQEDIFYNSKTVSDFIIYHLCHDKYSSREEAEKAGFDLSIVVAKIPVSLLFSKDKQTRDETYEHLCKDIQRDYKETDITSVIKRTFDAGRPEKYLQCLRIFSNENINISCTLDGSRDSLRARIAILYAKAANLPDPTVIQSKIEGGVLVANGSTKLPIDGQVLTLGYRAFDVQRTALDQSLSFDVELDSRIPCHDELAALPSTIVRYQLTPKGEGATEAPYALFHFYDGSGCGDGYDSRKTQFCVDPDAILDKNKISIRPTSSNCPAGDSAYRSITPVNDRCVEVTYGVKGCGFNGFGGCKGNGWLGLDVELGQVRIGAKKTGPTFDETKSYDSSFPQDVVPYGGEMPANFRLEDWLYQVNVTYFVLENQHIVKKEVALNENNRCDGGTGRKFKIYLEGAAIVFSSAQNCDNNLDDRVQRANFFRAATPCPGNQEYGPGAFLRLPKQIDPASPPKSIPGGDAFAADDERCSAK